MSGSDCQPHLIQEVSEYTMTISFFRSLHASFWTRDTYAQSTITVVSVLTYLVLDEEELEQVDQTTIQIH